MQEEKARTILDNVKDYALGKIKQRRERLELEETACLIDEISRILNKARGLNEELRVRLENQRWRY